MYVLILPVTLSWINQLLQGKHSFCGLLFLLSLQWPHTLFQHQRLLRASLLPLTLNINPSLIINALMLWLFQNVGRFSMVGDIHPLLLVQRENKHRIKAVTGILGESESQDGWRIVNIINVNRYSTSVSFWQI